MLAQMAAQAAAYETPAVMLLELKKQKGGEPQQEQRPMTVAEFKKAGKNELKNLSKQEKGVKKGEKQLKKSAKQIKQGKK